MLTFASIYISVQANNIPSDQTEIMELENTSRIEIRKAQLKNNSSKTANLSKWLVCEFDNANCSENEFLIREKIWDYGYALSDFLSK